MIDGVLLLVDAKDGPQAQTRFVLRKALESGARPIVVINKIDRDHARPDWVHDQVLELFFALDATEEQLDFPYVYASAKDGYATHDPNVREGDMTPLFEMILKHVPSPRAEELAKGYQLAVANVDYSDYLGRIAFGKIRRGSIRLGDPLYSLQDDRETASGKVTALFQFESLKQIQIEEAHAGDIVGISGLPDVLIGETLVDDPERPALPFKPDQSAHHQDGVCRQQRPVRRTGWQEGHCAPDLGSARRRPRECLRASRPNRREYSVPRHRPRQHADRHARRADAPERLRGARESPEVLKHQDESGEWLEPMEKIFWKSPRMPWVM